MSEERDQETRATDLVGLELLVHDLLDAKEVIVLVLRRQRLAQDLGPVVDGSHVGSVGRRGGRDRVGPCDDGGGEVVERVVERVRLGDAIEVRLSPGGGLDLLSKREGGWREKKEESAPQPEQGRMRSKRPLTFDGLNLESTCLAVSAS